MAGFVPDINTLMTIMMTFGEPIELKELAEAFSYEKSKAPEVEAQLKPLMEEAIRDGLIGQQGNLYYVKRRRTVDGDDQNDENEDNEEEEEDIDESGEAEAEAGFQKAKQD